MNLCLFAFEKGCEFSSTATAAWVQGLGSLAAVTAAILIARQSSLQTQEAVKRDVVRSIELVCSLCWQVHHYAEEVLRTVQEPDQVPMPKNLDRAIDLIDRYPVDRFPSGELALRSASIRRLSEAFREAQVDWHEHQAGRPTDGRGLAMMRVFAREIAAEYAALINCAQSLLDAQPGKRVIIPAELDDQALHEPIPDQR